MSIDIISKLFNINDGKTCVIGATLFDIDPAVGYSKNEMSPRKSKGTAPDKNINQISGLYIYPSIKHIQNEFSPKSFPTSMMNTWINGFIPNTKGLPTSETSCAAANELLDKVSVLKTDQVLPQRTDGLLETLFSFFKFHGQSDTILDPSTLECITEDKQEKLINKGMVHRKWLKSPLPIRYVIRKEGNDTVPDYLYFIGGSEELISDAPKDIINSIKELYLKSIYKRTFGDKKIRETIGVWDEVNKDITKDFTQTDKDLLLSTISFLRLNIATLFIRNYLYYAYNEMGIETIVEFNGEKPNKIPTKRVLDLYEEPYQYCKTIALITKK